MPSGKQGDLLRANLYVCLTSRPGADKGIVVIVFVLFLHSGIVRVESRVSSSDEILLADLTQGLSSARYLISKVCGSDTRIP